jgi:acyl-CoA thioesterase
MDEAMIRTRLDDGLAATEPDFGSFFLLRFFGFEVSYGDDTCTVRVPTSSYMHNPQGSLHGGVIAMAADISMGHLCHHVLSTCVTLDMDLRFIRPITGPARCEASFLKKGRTVVNLESRVYRENDDKLAAVANATWFRVPAENGDPS